MSKMWFTESELKDFGYYHRIHKDKPIDYNFNHWKESIRSKVKRPPLSYLEEVSIGREHFVYLAMEMDYTTFEIANKLNLKNPQNINRIYEKAIERYRAYPEFKRIADKCNKRHIKIKKE